MKVQYVALHVPDVERAERFYRGVFDMAVVTRESRGTDGRWRQLPRNAGWDEAREAGVEIHMVGLRSEGLLIPLFPGGDPRPGTVFLIGVTADPDEIAGVRSRLPEGTTVEVDEPGALTFLDPFGFRWQFSGADFIGPGDARGDWIEL